MPIFLPYGWCNWVVKTNFSFGNRKIQTDRIGFGMWSELNKNMVSWKIFNNIWIWVLLVFFMISLTFTTHKSPQQCFNCNSYKSDPAIVALHISCEQCPSQGDSIINSLINDWPEISPPPRPKPSQWNVWLRLKFFTLWLTISKRDSPSFSIWPNQAIECVRFQYFRWKIVT